MIQMLANQMQQPVAQQTPEAPKDEPEAKKRKFEDPSQIKSNAWKMFAKKTGMMLFFCKECSDVNYKNKEKFSIDSDVCNLNIKMCLKCAASNIALHGCYYAGFHDEVKK